MTLHLVTTCTQRKNLPAEPDMVMGGWDHVDHTCESLAAARMERALQVAEQRTLPAKALYAGAHWQIVRQIQERCGAELHVLSAGLGLLHAEDAVPGYQATFLDRQLDIPRQLMSGRARVDPIERQGSQKFAQCLCRTGNTRERTVVRYCRA